MKKKDKVAAALVLRGLAKDGKFSANANDANVKSAVENAVGKKEDVLKDVQLLLVMLLKRGNCLVVVLLVMLVLLILRRRLRLLVRLVGSRY
nr:variable large family protein [Borreliella burgdorferi]